MKKKTTNNHKSQSQSGSRITVIIPCYNEEEGIIHVLEGLPRERMNSKGFEIEVIVVDNNSTDNTSKNASRFDVKLIHEKRKGKGHALRAGLKAIHPDSNYIVIIDGDDTYKLHELYRMLEPLEADFSDIVVGSRLGGRMLDKSFSTLHRIGNWFFTFLVRHFYGANITDVLSGYISMKRPVALSVLEHLTVDDFRVEMEIVTKSVKMGYTLTSVPITYDKRRGTSKLVSFADGSRILQTLLVNVGWKK
jgi:dolichol-phosphate mannosyltransferase